jgi:hypothetical protein
MAATATDMMSTWEDQILETVHQGQEAVLKAVGIWAEAGGNLIPKSITLPYSDQLPAPTELAERYFDYTAKLIDAQRDFVGAILDAVKPVLDANGAASKR